MINIPEEIKTILHLDHWYKNIRIHFPNGERSDICNDLIVKDSVSFTESLCSQNTLKFGLCESPVFECEVVGVGNIKGAPIEVYCEVECDPAIEDSVFRNDLQKYVYPIPYGVFVVQECKRQADMQHRKIVAYNLLAVRDFGFNELEMHRAAYMNTDNSDFVQMIPALLTELLQSDIFGSAEKEITTSDKTFNYYKREPVSSAWPIYSHWTYKVAAFKMVTSESNKLYHVKCDRDDYSKENIQYCRWSPGETGGEPILPINPGIPMHPFFLPSGGLVIQSTKPISGYEYIYPYMSMANSSDNNAFFPANKNDNESLFIQAIYYEHYEMYTYAGTSTKRVMREWTKEYCDYSDLHICTVNLPYSFITSWEREVRTIPNLGTRYTVPNVRNIDLRPLVESMVELKGLFAGIDRFGKFFELNIKRQFYLAPDDELYPGSNLYPQGVTGGELYPEDYQSCWYDDYYSIPYGKVECQFKNTSNIDCVYEVYFGGFDEYSDINSYKTYFLNDNAIIKDSLWYESDIASICQNIIDNLEGVTYMPVDFVGRGLPYVEAGDTFEILTKSNESITTIVLNRTLTGEQTLTDSYKSV